MREKPLRCLLRNGKKQKPKGTLESEIRIAISLLGQRPPRYTSLANAIMTFTTCVHLVFFSLPPPPQFAEKSEFCRARPAPRRIRQRRPLLPSRKMPASEKDVAKDNEQGVVPVPADGENHSLLLTITGLSHPPPNSVLLRSPLLCVLRVWRALVRRLLACINVTCLCATLIVCIGA